MHEKWQASRLRLAELMVLESVDHSTDQRHPVNEAECNINCDDCGIQLDSLKGEDIFIDRFVFDVPMSKIVCCRCWDDYRNRKH